ncbi:hypothetical protein [Thiobacter aerophilum]|uniref:Alpha/beta hydrolase n=1 Tax=Thiobacter aerophilum TaxID=3121275 RepID=A0ABV0EKF1_9BURK
MKLLFMCLTLLLPLATRAMDVSLFALPNGTEVAVRPFPATGDRLLLWFPCDEGQSTAEAKAAAALLPQGIETWLPDMLGAHFLPMAPSSMDQLPAEEIAALIELAQQTGKRVYLLTAGRGALPVLRGLARWRSTAAGREVQGVVLVYPELYAGTPAPGTEARYEPVVHETVSRIVILQGARSPGRWWLSHLVQVLQAAGSRVKATLLPGVRGYFFLREEQTPEEAAMAARLPDLVRDALDRIDSMKQENQP